MVVYSDNAIVNEVGQLDFSGNIIHSAWYHTIKKESGKTDLLAINILADIVFWYRPQEVRREGCTEVRYEKKFRSDILQQGYKYFTEKFGMSEKQIREALKVLEGLDVVRREFRNIELADGTCVYNVMFLRLNPVRLKELTYPETPQNPHNDNDSDKENRWFQSENQVVSEKEIGVVPKKETPPSQNGNTNTKSTSKTTELNTYTEKDYILLYLNDIQSRDSKVIDNINNIQEPKSDKSRSYEALLRAMVGSEDDVHHLLALVAASGGSMSSDTVAGDAQCRSEAICEGNNSSQYPFSEAFLQMTG